MIDLNDRPGIHTQLNNGHPTAGYDCGVEGTIRSIDFASYGQVILEEPFVRKLMSYPGHDLTGKTPTNPADWKRAIESDEVAQRFRKVGLQPPHARLLDGVPIAVAQADLAKGRMVTAAIWYGTLNRLTPNKSGSLTFHDNHCASILDELPSARTSLFDSLDDGRTVDGHRYPKGPLPVHLSDFWRMCGNVALRTRNAAGEVISSRRLGQGRFLGITVARAKLIDGGTHTPPPETPEQVIARLTQELASETAAHAADLQSALDQANALVDDIETSLEAMQP